MGVSEKHYLTPLFEPSSVAGGATALAGRARRAR